MGYGTSNIGEGIRYTVKYEQSLRSTNEEGGGQSDVEKVLRIALVGVIE